MESNTTTKRLAAGVLSFGYSQIQVRFTDEGPNEWCDAHVRQGFAWRPGSVSFSMLPEGGLVDVVVELSASASDSADAIRRISVPFDVLRDSVPITVSTTDLGAQGGLQFVLSRGPYTLVFELGPILDEGKDSWARFLFLPGRLLQPSVLLADAALTPPRELIMTATEVEEAPSSVTNFGPDERPHQIDSPTNSSVAMNKTDYLESLGLRKYGLRPEDVVSASKAFDSAALQRICEYLRKGLQPREAAGTIWGFFRDYPQAERFYSAMSSLEMEAAVTAMSLREGPLDGVPTSALVPASPLRNPSSFEEADKVALVFFFYAMRRVKAKSFLTEAETKMIHSYRLYIEAAGER